MSSEQIRSLKATELRLLQERTNLQKRVDEVIATPSWAGDTMQDLNRQLDRLDTELHGIRAELRRLDREDGAASP